MTLWQRLDVKHGADSQCKAPVEPQDEDPQTNLIINSIGKQPSPGAPGNGGQERVYSIFFSMVRGGWCGHSSYEE